MGEERPAHDEPAHSGHAHDGQMDGARPDDDVRRDVGTGAKTGGVGE